jgi:signal transduction histidine kinase
MDNASGQECRLALIDITERKKAADDLRSYARRLVEMEEDLRKKIASELHDEIGRDLTVLGLNQAFISQNLVDGASMNLVARVRDSSRLIEGISRTVRGIMVMLRPPVLDDYGLLAALRWHADLFTKRTGIAVIILADEPLPSLMVEKEMALFRIAQEALMNASKHAATTEVTITVSSDNGLLYFVVCDHGKGFTPASIKHAQADSGWGMNSMRERAELIGGTFQVDSAPGKGTVVSVEIPLEEV